MKKGILVTAIFGIIFSNSAFSDSFIYRQEMPNVKRSETFGMSVTEKEAYDTNKSMCLNEKPASSEVRYDINHTYILVAINKRLRPREVKYTISIDGNYHLFEVSGSPTLPDGDVSMLNSDLSMYTDHRAYIMTDDSERTSTYSEDVYYSVLVVEPETENYQWCIDNGFKTS